MNNDQFMRFCAKNEIREWLLKPFRIGSDLCASNGHALCVRPGKGAPSTEEPDSSILPQLIKSVGSAATTPVESTQYATPDKCTACSGSGKSIFEKCRECDGEGEVDAETDYSTYCCLECKSCGGDCGTWNSNTDRECDQCNGSGNKPDTELVWLNDHDEPIQNRYFDLIKDLPDLEVGMLMTKTGKAVAFRFDGGEGCIMTVRNKKRPEAA